MYNEIKLINGEEKHSLRMPTNAQWGKPMTLSMRSGQNQNRNFATFDKSTQTLD